MNSQRNVSMSLEYSELEEGQQNLLSDLDGSEEYFPPTIHKQPRKENKQNRNKINHSYSSFRTEKARKKEKEMFVNIDRQFQQIYTNESKAKKKEIYEIIYTEEFKKLQAYKDNINSIYDEMIEMVHEIKNQKKAIYSYTKKLEKMKNDMLDSIQVFNEWLIKLQKKEEEKKTIKKNYSFGKEEDQISNVYATFIGSVEELELKKIQQQEPYLDSKLLKIIFIIKSKLQGRQCELSEQLISEVGDGDKVKEMLYSVKQSLDRYAHNRTQLKSEDLQAFFNEVKQNIRLSEKRVKNQENGEDYLFTLQIVTLFTYTQLIISQHHQNNDFSECTHKLLKQLNLLRIKSGIQFSEQRNAYIEECKDFLSRLNQMNVV